VSQAASTPWRDNIEAMTMAVVMALLLKGFIIEAYKIPTGSMQPTLIGDDQADVKDRILADKLTYALRDPKRWEVAVFRYPLNQAQNFIKRIAGVGPEEFKIQFGDLWRRDDASEDWQVLRRPRSVQQDIWKRLDISEPEGTSWRVTNDGKEWELAGRSIRARGSGSALFRNLGSIMDRYFDGYPEVLVPLISKNPKPNLPIPVGDLRLSTRATCLPGTKELRLELHEGLKRYVFHFPGPAAPEGAKARIEVHTNGRLGSGGPRVFEGPARRLAAGQSALLAVQNMDDLLTLEWDGELLVEAEVEPMRDQASSALVASEGEGTDFEDLMVYRDIYYLSEGRAIYQIPAGHYLMLGDNTQNSSDSRHWRFARLSQDGGATELRGNYRRDENPRTVGYGEEEGPWRRLVDEFGEVHWLPSLETESLSPLESPFVPREMMLGKALAVFWPVNPIKEIYRFKWVH